MTNLRLYPFLYSLSGVWFMKALMSSDYSYVLADHPVSFCIMMFVILTVLGAWGDVKYDKKR